MLICLPMDGIPSALARAAYIPGLVFEALVRARGGLYSAALLPRRRLPAPVISIGNMTMGGSGKTPLVICVAQILLSLGLSPAILTRGYGRVRGGESHILSPGETVPAPASTLGDEPALIRRHLPSTWMGVSKDRFLVGTIISNRRPHVVFVLDDGFQHRGLHRDLDIVIIDSSQPLRSNRVFPRGTLREPASGLSRCDLVVINDSNDASRCIEKEIRDIKSDAKVFRCKQTIRPLVPFVSWQANEGHSSEQEKQVTVPKSAFLVGALGNPERFRSDVQRLGIDIKGSRFFRDHYKPTSKDWQACVEQARRSGVEALITTEKDAVKIGQNPDYPLLVAVQSTEIFDAHEFETVLKTKIEEKR